MLRTVIIHGEHAGRYNVVADTIAEAITAVTRQIKTLQPVLGRPRQSFQIVDCDQFSEMTKPSDMQEIHLVPSFTGGKGNGGFIQIVLGAVLIAASFIPGLNVALVGSVTLSGMLFSMGMSLALGGVLAMMSPAPKRDSTLDTGFVGDPEQSKYLGSPKNTVAIGTRIPVGYGRHRVSGHFISFDIQAKDVQPGGSSVVTPQPTQDGGTADNTAGNGSGQFDDLTSGGMDSSGDTDRGGSGASGSDGLGGPGDNGGGGLV